MHECIWITPFVLYFILNLDMPEFINPKNAAHCYTIADLRQLAKTRLPKAVFDFIDGAAEEENTLKNNLAAFSNYRWLPHVLNDVSEVSTQTTLFDRSMSLPFGIGPTGGAGFGHPKADLALAKTAAKHGIPYTLSSSATTTIETIAKQAGGRLWFQAYVLRDKDFFWHMIERAHACDFEGLMITVDLPVGGKRVKDFHNHFSLPFKLTRRNLLDFSSRPSWLIQLLTHGVPTLANLKGLDKAATTKASSFTKLASTVGKNYDPAFNFESLAKVRERWRGKLIVKGVSRPDDAQKIMALGCDAIVVSNHGGRQLDGAMATLDALPDVVKAIDHKIPVLMDSGIRHGGDIAKALALGASGVLIGRASLYGAVAQADEGAQRAVDILSEELQRTMQLCGVTEIGQFNETFLKKI
jgi:(S)-mandelate dehydrogenase